MSYLIVAFSFLWLALVVKSALFWLYLWQLKEYHTGRFFDHFNTHKGKQLIFGLKPTLKIILFVLFFYFPLLTFYALLTLYILEFAEFSLNFQKKKFLKPVFTAKIWLLFLASLLVIIFYLLLLLPTSQEIYFFALWLLGFDILLPLVISAVVLLFQPFFVLLRLRILNKAKNRRAQFKDLTVIGITGSYGKTSTKEFLKTILSAKYNVLATSGHKNSEMGIAETILNNLNERHDVFIAEMGAYRRGGIKLLCDIIKPQIGIVTGVNQQHLATFGSMENLLSAEGGLELASCLPKGGLIILNGDNKYCMQLYKKIEGSEFSISKRIYSVKGNRVESDIWTEDLVAEKENLSFITMTAQKELTHFDVNILGSHNIQNLLAAILTAKELGMSWEEISSACQDIEPEQGSIILKQGFGGINVIDASYSSNPDGVIADLDYLNLFKGTRAVVMPCLIELGEESAKIHYSIGKKIGQVCNMAIITTKDHFEEIKKGAVSEGMPAHPPLHEASAGQGKIIFEESPQEILHLISSFCKEDDAVLLEGRIPDNLKKILHEE